MLVLLLIMIAYFVRTIPTATTIIWIAQIQFWRMLKSMSLFSMNTVFMSFTHLLLCSIIDISLIAAISEQKFADFPLSTHLVSLDHASTLT